MPELPEVETVRRGLEPHLLGKSLVHVEARRPDLRFPLPRDMGRRLGGRTVTALWRRAKYLLLTLSDEGCGEETLLCHLGMSGSFSVVPGEDNRAHRPGVFHHARQESARHDHVVMVTNEGARITYNDPRRFGFMLLERDVQAFPMLAALGPEPNGNVPLAPHLAQVFAGKRTPLKAALLDQGVIAGLGNIYVCEALHRAGLSPERSAASLAGDEAGLERLEVAIRAVIGEAIEAGGSSLRDHRQTDGTLGYFQHTFRVYDREGGACATPSCAGTVVRIRQAGRSTFFCASCQR